MSVAGGADRAYVIGMADTVLSPSRGGARNVTSLTMTFVAGPNRPVVLTRVLAIHRPLREGRLEVAQPRQEGQVNRLKYLKRQMYGRAKFDLLRQRVLYAA